MSKAKTSAIKKIERIESEWSKPTEPPIQGQTEMVVEPEHLTTKPVQT